MLVRQGALVLCVIFTGDHQHSASLARKAVALRVQWVAMYSFHDIYEMVPVVWCLV
jgi:hypothetical protein